MQRDYWFDAPTDMSTLHEDCDKRCNRADISTNAESELEEHLRRAILLLGVYNYDEKTVSC